MSSGTNSSHRKLLLLEINEVTWDWIDPLITKGKLPTFAALKKRGTVAAPMSVDMPPHMDPWVTWTTLYTGREQSEHNLLFLQQPPETIGAERIWEICNSSGLRVGVYGSLCSWPPQKVDGYYVPDTFAPSPETYPDSLQPIQRMNLTYTRANNLPEQPDSLRFRAQLGLKLLTLGLSPRTMTAVAGQLYREMRDGKQRFRRVALQPQVNFDFFSKLYSRYRPDFATFHTNHVAHYMHNYWNTAQPELFPQETTREQIETYGGAIEFGYAVADNLLKRALALLDSNTVLVVASSLGQQPYITNLRTGSRNRVLRSLEKIAEILCVKGRAKFLSTMANQFNIYPNDPETQQYIVQALGSAYVDDPSQPMFYVTAVENSLTITLRRYDGLEDESRVFFPDVDRNVSHRYGDLIYFTGATKSGMHHPKGMMILYGPGIRAGASAGDCNNLDIAPTLLTLLGVPVPPTMKGRVLSEAFLERPVAAAI